MVKEREEKEFLFDGKMYLRMGKLEEESGLLLAF